MVTKAYHIIRTARPRQWLKNLSLFAAPFFSGLLFTNQAYIKTFYAFLVFIVISSGVYYLNDYTDKDKDSKHPVKKNRAIASGKISAAEAKFMILFLLGGGLVSAYFFIGTYFFFISITYVVLQLAYSFYFRNVIILDSLVVASGFILRVFAGGVAAESSISSWLVLTTIGLSLLMAFGKRRSEKTLLTKHFGDKEIDTRKTLRHYPDTLLDSMLTMSATFCILTYSLFTFQVSPEGVSDVVYRFLPSIFATPKWMMLTIPFVIYGVARYLYVIYEKKEGESPARVLLSDTPLLITVSLWGLTLLLIIYIIPAVYSSKEDSSSEDSGSTNSSRVIEVELTSSVASSFGS